MDSLPHLRAFRAAIGRRVDKAYADLREDPYGPRAEYLVGFIGGLHAATHILDGLEGGAFPGAPASREGGAA